MAFWTVLLKFWNQFAKPIFIAHHESHGRVVALNEVVEVERLSEDKEAATEGVPFFQLGVFGVLHDELVISEIAEGAAAIGLPRHGDEVADRQVFGLDMFALHLVGTAVLADVVDETVPIAETEETREDVECAVTGFVGAVDIAPKAFQCGGAEVFVRALPDGATEECEVVGSSHLSPDAFFDLLLEFGDFWTGFLHGDSVYVAKMTFLFEIMKFFLVHLMRAREFL